ncbi:MAG: methyltransferase domain-containing protein [Methylococcales bacterium]|nr:methyltransferase domain-containing protein [Methylococcales bacterium]
MPKPDVWPSTAALRYLLHTLDWREIALGIAFCPLCQGQRPFLKTAGNELSVRCCSCRATPITLSLAAVLAELDVNVGQGSVYELSARGPWVRYLRQHCPDLTCSEYFTDVEPGTYRQDVLCQDVQKLTFADASFDLCTSTEVFEHVPDDRKGFAELWRVLKPGGVLLFTVPFNGQPHTLERAYLKADGSIKHLQPPDYHGDPLRPEQGILVFRDYGQDVLERLREAGFDSADIRQPQLTLPWPYQRPVIIAFKA